MTRIIKSQRKGYEPSGWKSMELDQPRDCYVCGKTVTLKESIGFRTCNPKQTWHTVCVLGRP